jgi:hypothetical protein
MSVSREIPIKSNHYVKLTEDFTKMFHVKHTITSEPPVRTPKRAECEITLILFYTNP